MTFFARGVRPISPSTARSPRPIMNSTAERTLFSSTPRLASTFAATPSPSRTSQEDVLRADIVVVEAVRLFLRQRQHTSCPLSEFVESIGHCVLQPLWLRQGND